MRKRLHISVPRLARPVSGNDNASVGGRDRPAAVSGRMYARRCSSEPDLANHCIVSCVPYLRADSC